MKDRGAPFDDGACGFAGIFGVHQLRAVGLFPRVAFFNRQKLDLVESRFAGEGCCRSRSPRQRIKIFGARKLLRLARAAARPRWLHLERP
jgi:hypothetical protein